MEGKWVLVAVIAISILIPAVAIADVIITGNVSVQVSQGQYAFTINPGPNYNTANNSKFFGWRQQNQSPDKYLGTAWIGTISNETITEVNVLEINFSSSIQKNSVFVINVTDGRFANNTFMIVSTSPLTILPDGNIFGSSGTLIFSLYSGNSVVTGNYPGITVGSFSVSPSTHLYVGFYIPPQGGMGDLKNNNSPPPPPDPPSPPSPRSPDTLETGSFVVQFYLTDP